MKQKSIFPCPCYEVVKKINEDCPGCNWNCDSACSMWAQEATKLKNNEIVFEAYSDEQYACTCPTCGKIICNWCV